MGIHLYHRPRAEDLTLADVYVDTLGVGIAHVSGTRLTVPSENDAATPTLAFGDGDTGLYEYADDYLIIATAGSARFTISHSWFKAANGAAILNTDTSSTVPVFVPDVDDDNTGIGCAGTDQLSLIAGGVEGIRLTESTGVLQTHQLTAGITAHTDSAQGSGVLASSYNEISTCANVGDAVTLPSASAGIKVTIINNGSNAADVFPASGDDCGGGADTAVSLAAGANITYLAYDATTWEVI